MSDQMSVSSATTGVASNQPGHAQYQNYNYHLNPGVGLSASANDGAYPVQQQPQRMEPLQNHYNQPTYFYPSSHIHNQAIPLHAHPLSQHPPTPYISSPAPPPFQPQSPPSLTSTLLASSPHQLSLATQHPFLRIAGQGQLPKLTLSRWLSQDRLYAQSYIGFIGSLIARVDLPYTHVPDKSTSLRWRLVQCLTAALQNIHTELAFFATTAHTYRLDLEAPSPSSSSSGRVFAPEPATKQYMDLFRAFWTDPSMTLLEGMVVLWATETVYLRAWTYAASFLKNGTSSSLLPLSKQLQRIELDDEKDNDRKSKALSDGVMSELEGSEVNTALSGTTTGIAHDESQQNQKQHYQDDDNDGQQRHGHGHGHGHAHTTDLDGGALRHAFIPNWTSSQFEGFVAEIAELTDLLAEREDAVNRKLDFYKAVWRHVLDVERRFWPDV
ncbi:hypothetical protein G647_01745 [Cladophialophora carrionii CBS 160.54]|uniref:Thiaminase-2/PQQC domain-containing protein n=1 Tax=Cladophialophora carrionii CBS 160.54 TaxID=1279043 RepID=V9DTI0_9EURO|nr:uncharacterized protein G647_01745 [Cladophialophora carrionii CBS 160.54]ETI29292.1 hypothetical protein G647_01745 [Cladophialophora carrionii CBS 160.54]